MKKVGNFIKKNKERIITLDIIIIVLFFMGLVFRCCLRFGIITPPKSVMLWYFNNNRETFDYIVEYVEENPEITIDIVYPDTEEMMRIEDDRLRNSMGKLLFKSGGFSYISYYPSDKEGDREIIFLIPNFSVKEGEGVAIIYSEHALQSGCEDVGHDEVYYYEYERIDGNWYYKYRVW